MKEKKDEYISAVRVILLSWVRFMELGVCDVGVITEGRQQRGIVTTGDVESVPGFIGMGKV